MSTGYQLNLSRSFRFHSNRETITLADAVGSVVCTVQDSKRLGGADAEKSPSHGKYLEFQSSWRLPQPNVTGQILPGWTITDADSVVWTILDVAYPRNQNQAWQIYANRLLFNGQLDDLVTWIQSSCDSSSATGARTVTDRAIGAAVAAAIEPERASIGDQFGTKAFAEFYMIYLDVDPSGDSPSQIKAGDMLQDQDGAQYEIVDVIDRLRLDMKPCFRCVKKL